MVHWSMGIYDDLWRYIYIIMYLSSGWKTFIKQILNWWSYVHIYTSFSSSSLSLYIYIHIIYYKYITPITCLKLVVLPIIPSINILGLSWDPQNPTAPRISHGLAAVHGQPHGHGHLRRIATARQARGVGLAKGARRSIIIKENNHRVMVMNNMMMMGIIGKW